MNKSSRKELAESKVSIGYIETGLLQLISRHSAKCTYSSTRHSPVIERISIRPIAEGIAQLRIDGKEFEYREIDPSLQMAVPK